MKTDTVKYLQIARILKDGRLTWAEAFDNSSKILDDEGKPINVLNALESLREMLPTGGREIHGVSDFYGNAFEILKHTLIDSEDKGDKAEGFSTCGASYLNFGDIYLLGDFNYNKVPDEEHDCGVGAAML